MEKRPKSKIEIKGIERCHELRKKDSKKFEDFKIKPNKINSISIEKINNADKYFYKYLSNNFNRINEKDFENNYTPEKVKEDLDKVKKRQGNFSFEKKTINKSLYFSEKDSKILDSEKKHKMANIFENIMPILVSKNNLFGKNAEPILTSKYDDIFNGVDMLVEFSNNNTYSHLGLAIDLTVSNKDNIKKKVEKIRDNLHRNRTTSIKYFHSKKMGIKGTLEDLPKLIITGSLNTVLELIRFHGAYIKNKENTLESSKFNFQTIEELLIQIEYFIKDVQKEEIRNKYTAIRDILSNVLESKIENVGIEKYDKLRNQYDRGFYALKEVLEESYDPNFYFKK